MFTNSTVSITYTGFVPWRGDARSPKTRQFLRWKLRKGSSTFVGSSNNWRFWAEARHQICTLHNAIHIISFVGIHWDETVASCHGIGQKKCPIYNLILGVRN